MNVALTHPKEKEAYGLGEKMFFYRGGPHDFACATCHGEDGKRIRLQDLPNLTNDEGAQKAYTTWPAYRVSQGELRTFQWRLNDCFRQQRFPELVFASDASIALTMFLARNANGARVRRAGHQALTEARDEHAMIGMLVAVGARSRRSLVGCATAPSRRRDSRQGARPMLKASFKAAGPGEARPPRPGRHAEGRAAKYAGKALPKEVAERIEKTNLATIKWPADGKYLGDWKNGEKIAQEGRGKQYSDDPKGPVGGNCYACHQLTPQEVSYGTIGPSLYQFGKMRGYTRRDAQVRLRQDLQRRGVQRLLEHAALRPQRHPDRAADQGRRGAAAGSGLAGQQVASRRGAARRVARAANRCSAA